MKKLLISFVIIILLTALYAAITNTYSLYFNTGDASNDDVTFSDGLFDFGTSDFSISCWYKSSISGTGQERILGQRDAGANNFIEFMVLEVDGDIQLRIRVLAAYNLNILSNQTTTINDGAWHMITVVCPNNDAANNFIYLDGVKLTGYGSQVNNSASKTPVGILKCCFGQRGDDNDYMEASYVDEIAIYSSALSQAQVTQIYAGGRAYDLSQIATLTHWWRFEEGSGTSIGDSKGAATGTLSNATFSTDAPTAYIEPVIITTKRDFGGWPGSFKGFKK